MSITFVFTALTRGEQSLGEALHGLRDYLVAVFLHFDLGVTDVNAAEIPYNLPGGFRLAHFGMHLDEVHSHLPDPPALQAVVLEASAIIAAACSPATRSAPGSTRACASDARRPDGLCRGRGAEAGQSRPALPPLAARDLRSAQPTARREG